MRLADDRATEHRALLRLAAGGFRDMTRIASGHPGIWPDICAENRTAIVDVLDGLLASLAEVRAIVADDDRDGLLAVLEQARTARANLPSRLTGVGDLCEVRIPVPDRAGVLAEVTTLAGTLDVNIADLEIAHSSEGDRGVLILLVEAGAAERLRAGLVDQGYRPVGHPPGVADGPARPVARSTPIDGPLDVVVSLPGSKSITNRALVCAALADGTSTLTNALARRRHRGDGGRAPGAGRRRSRPTGPTRRLVVTGTAGPPDRRRGPRRRPAVGHHQPLPAPGRRARRGPPPRRRRQPHARATDGRRRSTPCAPSGPRCTRSARPATCPVEVHRGHPRRAAR